MCHDAARAGVILIGLGANLPSHVGGPVATLTAALALLQADGRIRVAACSRWYESAPVPVSDQPWFVNGVARLDTTLSPAALLARLHETEGRFGRRRMTRNEARPLDLDLLDYDGRVEAGPPVLPHPRLAARAFVLLPLRELDPDWRHPADGATVLSLIAALDPAQVIRPL